MDPQKTIHIKQEETDCAPDEPGLMCYQTLTMDHQHNIQIKEEETDCAPDEPGFTFVGVPGLPIKPDPELELHVDSSENNSWEYPLETSWTTDIIQEEPAQNLEAEDTVNSVVASTSCVQNSFRVIQNTFMSCGMSSGENVVPGLVPNELKIHAEDSTCLSMANTHTQGQEVKEESLFDARLKCRQRENEFYKFICNFCLQSFSSKYRLIKHVFLHMDDVQPPPYICKSCGEIFSSEIDLNRHFKMNERDQAPSSGHNDTADGIYKYENLYLQCDKTSVIQLSEKQSSPQLKSNASRATGTKSHECNVCGKYFMYVAHLNRHTLMHTGEKPHKCNVCGKSFSQLCNLKKHALTHTGEKPHKCNFCGESFTELGTLKKHSLMHTGAKPYECKDCFKSFRELRYLRRHSLIHKGVRPHKCNVCGNSFLQLCHLKQHELIHSGQRTHKCNICGKSFIDSSHLKIHSLIHSGVKPHKCIVCGQCFSQSGSLRRHSLLHQ